MVYKCVLQTNIFCLITIQIIHVGWDYSIIVPDVGYILLIFNSKSTKTKFKQKN